MSALTVIDNNGYQALVDSKKTYSDVMKFIHEYTGNVDTEMGFLLTTAEALASAEGIEADFSTVKLANRKLCEQQIKSLMNHWNETAELEKLQIHYPKPLELPSTAGSNVSVKGKSTTEKVLNYKEIKEAYVTDIINGKIKNVNVAGSPATPTSSKIYKKKLSKLHTKVQSDDSFLLYDEIKLVEKELGITIEPPTSYIKKYNADKKAVVRKYGKDTRLDYSNMPDCAQLRFEQVLESEGLGKLQGGAVDFGRISSMDKGIIGELREVVEDWKTSRADIIKAAHPDTGGNHASMRVMNVVNMIMKDVIALMEYEDREADRNKRISEYTDEVLADAKVRINAGEFKDNGEYYEQVLVKECNE